MKAAAIPGEGGGTIGAVFAASAWRHHREPAVLEAAGRTVTWGELVAEVRSLTLGLVDLGLDAGAAVAIHGHGGFQERCNLLAVASAGLVAAPAATSPPGGGPDGAVVVDGTPVAVEVLRERGRVLDAAVPDRFETRLAQVAADAPAVVLDGTIFTHADLVWAARSFAQAIGLHAGDRVVTDLTLGDQVGHVVGQVGPLVAGAATAALGLDLLPLVRPTVLVVGEESAQRVSSLVAGRSDGRSPGRLRTLRRSLADLGLEQCRMVIVVGTAGVPRTLRSLTRGGTAVLAATRFGGVAGLVTMGEPTGSGDLGRPLPGTSLGIGHDGEVHVRSGAVAGGETWSAIGRRGALVGDGRLRLDPATHVDPVAP